MIKISNKLLKELEPHKETIKMLFQTKNYTDKEISKVIGFSPITIGRYRRLESIDKLYKDKNWLKDKVEKGLSQVKIAKLCGCSTKPIMKYMLLYGLMVKKEKRQLNIKDDFFNEYNEESSYWAGFINADGHLSQEDRYGTKAKQEFLEINLSAKDISHLRKFNSKLSNDNLIREYNTNIKTKVYKMCSLKVSRKSICKDLNSNFDISYNNKSLQEVISEKIPKEYLKDFLRGHFDGDGSVGIYNNTAFLSLVGGKKLCEDFKNIISNECGQEIGCIYKDSRNENMYYYKITNSNGIKLLYSYMYYENCTCLERKREIFEKILHKI